MLKTIPIVITGILFGLLLYPSNDTSSSTEIILIGEQHRYALGKHLQFLQDPTGTLTIEQVASPEYDTQFYPSPSKSPNFGYTNATVWVKFRLKNQNPAIDTWYLQHGYPNTQHIYLYRPTATGTGFEAIKTGTLYPAKTREIPYRNFVFSLPLPFDQEQTFYLRLQSEATLLANLTLWQPSAFYKKSNFDLLTKGLLFGSLVTAAIYSLFMWFSLKDNSYLYYILLISSITICLLAIHGLAPQYLWPNMPWLNLYVIPISNNTSIILRLIWSTHFLQIKSRTPWLHNLFLGLLGWCAFILIQVPIVPYRFVVQQNLILAFVSLVIVVMAGVVVWRQGHQEARFYVVGWGGILIIIFWTTLIRFGYLPAWFVIYYALDLSLIWLSLFLLLALADRINLLRQYAEHANIAIQASANRLNQYLEAMPTGVAVFTPQLKTAYINDTGRQLLNRPEANTYQTLSQAAKTDDFHRSGTTEPYPITNLPVSRILRGETTTIEDLEIVVKGQSVALEVSGKPIIGIDNEVEYAILVFQDITERRMNEQELASYRTKLEEMVSQRTSALKQEIAERERAEIALRQAKEKAEAANQAKSVFLANMSHELRSPLNGVMGFAELLSWDDNLTPKQKHNLNIIHRSGDHLLTLIDDVLNLAKIEADRLELEPTDIQLGTFMMSLVDLFKARAQKKGLFFLFETEFLSTNGQSSDNDPPQPETSLPTVQTDAKRLRQVLLNLISNAIKFTKTGGVTLQITTQSTAAQQVSTCFKVCDTGPGIAVADQQRAFEPFIQVGDLDSHPGGTGLGLSISRSIVALLGGTLHLESELGAGSTFWFELTLPVVSPSIVEPNQRQIIGIHGPSPTILVVDDKVNNRALLQEMLQRVGCQVMVATNGQEGLSLAEQTEPHCIITDIVMPKLSGLKLVSHLRQQPQFAHTPIIVSSASVFDTDRHQSLAVGGTAFLPKPVHSAALYELLETHVSVQWQYQNKEKEESPVPDSPDDNIILPPSDVLDKLRQLLMVGEISETKQMAAQLPAAHQPFAQQLITLINNFQLEEALTWVGNHHQT